MYVCVLPLVAWVSEATAVMHMCVCVRARVCVVLGVFCGGEPGTEVLGKGHQLVGKRNILLQLYLSTSFRATGDHHCVSLSRLVIQVIQCEQWVWSFSVCSGSTFLFHLLVVNHQGWPGPY
jgi:hypothetical protein